MSVPSSVEKPPLRLVTAQGESVDRDGQPLAQAPATQAPTAPVAAARPDLAGIAVPQVPPFSLPPSEADFAFFAEASAKLETATPREILQWSVEHYFPKLTMATAFGPEGCVIIHLLAQIEPRVHVFNLDTGYQFNETLELRERIRQRYGIEVELRRPETTVEEYEALNGGPVYKNEPDRCCAERKIKVLHESAIGYRAWMSGIRRDQSTDRARAAIVEWDKKFNLVKISPLANWTKKDVWKLITDHDIPYNPLHDQGYTSIGCQPCTRAVLFGEDERAGRWSGFAKTECGLHTKD